MALKFLNKKGWHTGSLRNIENVWKAEQKHEAEQKKLEELRKQIHDERERSEFRLLQEQAGLLPRQERLEFLYDSGLAVGKGSSTSTGGGSGVAFKALEEAVPSTSTTTSSAAAAKQPSVVPGALFEDKPHSANDAWRKLHSDPLLLIRQREQEALSRIKNNPVQMASIRKSVEANKEEKAQTNKNERSKKHKHGSTKGHKHSSSRKESDSEDGYDGREITRDIAKSKRSRNDEDYYKAQPVLEDKSSKSESQRRKGSYKSSNVRDISSGGFSGAKATKNDCQDAVKKSQDNFTSQKHHAKNQTDPQGDLKERETRNFSEARSYYSSAATHHDSHYKRRNAAPKLSEEQRAAKLREMQVDAALHEEQRWKRLRKAEEDDAREATHSSISGSRSFLDAVQRSVYGTEKGGSKTIEESVRRRAHYSQGRSEAGDVNAFRR